MKRFLLLLLCCFVDFLFADDIVFLNSDVTTYKDGAVHCAGNVIAVYAGQVISAREVFYDKNANSIEADGEVVIKDKYGNAYFADKITIIENFKSGQAENIKVILSDKSRLAAAVCKIVDGKYLLENVIYTPCYECNDAGNLTWQAKAATVLFDPKSCTEYENAQIEFFNTPVFYTPTLTHVSPAVKRKSGLLVPEFKVSSRNGFSVMPRFLYSISDSQELIFKPLITTKSGAITGAYYGTRFQNGEFNVDASVTGTSSAHHSAEESDFERKTIDKIKHSAYRGHLFSKLNYELDEIWRCGFDINLASDRYYLKRFDLIPNLESTLESNVKLEGFDGDNYTLVKGALFQTDNLDCTPRILPLIERNYVQDLLTGTLGLDINFMNLDFNGHRSAQKFIANLSWEKEVLFPGGQIFDIFGRMMFRTLRVYEKLHSDYDSATIINPQLGCIWKFPLFFPKQEIVFTPIAGIIQGGNRKYSDIFEMPFNELTMLNLFNGSRSISPYDIDSGSRFCYGARVAGYHKGDNLYQFALGRSKEISKLQKNLEVSGVKHKDSNILASLDIFINDRLTFVSRGSYCEQSGRWTQAEAGLLMNFEKFDANIMAFSGREFSYNPFDENILDLKEEKLTKRYKGVSCDFGYKVNSKWKLTGGINVGNYLDSSDDATKVRANADRDRCKLLQQKVGVLHKNECAEFHLEICRNNHRGGDLKPNTTLKFCMHLKNLGM